MTGGPGPLVVTTLAGGLGNQMFQYACGRAFAMASNAELVLDTSGLRRRKEGVTARSFELDAYPIVARKETTKEAPRFERAARWGMLGERVSGIDVIKEKPSLYPDVVRAVNRDTLLKGFWQSEVCFASIADRISTELTPRRMLSPQSLQVADVLERTPSVAIHVRRGDYVNLPSAARFHGSVPLTYYQAAAQRIRACHAQPVWAVFSDDIDWCRGALTFLSDAAMFVAHNQGQDAWQDLHLMSLCRHHIIANSSFSWWGAWLSEQRGWKDQLIHAPARWFAADDPFADFRVPKRWVRL